MQNFQEVQEICALCDRSGSMYGKENDTIGGINTTISELKKNQENTTTNFTLKLFDHEVFIKFNRININNIPKLVETDFTPRGSTALLDCLGETLQYYINLKETNNNEFNSCMIYIVTDGLENASKYFTYHNIQELVKKAEEMNINIIYIGANQDAIAEASKCGITPNRAMNYSETTNNTCAAYRSLANATTRSRKKGFTGFTQVERQSSLTLPQVSHLLPNQAPRSLKHPALPELQIPRSPGPSPLNESRETQVPILTRQRTNTNIPNTQEQHKFLDYAKYNNFNKVIELIQQNNNYINCQPSGRWSALHHAANNNNSDLVCFLLSNGANKTLTSNNNKTPLDITPHNALAIRHLLQNSIVINSNQ